MVFEQIKKLHEYGFSLFPCGVKKKVPWKGMKYSKYKKHRLPLAFLASWFSRHPNMNIGVIMESSNLVVLDLENEDALREIEKHGKLPKTVVAESGRFRHYYFKRGQKPPRHKI